MAFLVAEAGMTSRFLLHHVRGHYPWPVNAGHAERPKSGVGCLVGWIDGAAGYIGLGWGLGSYLYWPDPSLSILLCLVWALFFGLVATGIRVAISWSSSGWNKLSPGRLVLRLVVSTLVFTVTILVTAAIVAGIVIGNGLSRLSDL